MALRKALSYAGQALHILKLLNSECRGVSSNGTENRDKKIEFKD